MDMENPPFTSTICCLKMRIQRKYMVIWTNPSEVRWSSYLKSQFIFYVYIGRDDIGGEDGKFFVLLKLGSNLRSESVQFLAARMQ